MGKLKTYSFAHKSRVMLWLQLRFDFDSTRVRRLIKGHQGHSDVTRYTQSR